MKTYFFTVCTCLLMLLHTSISIDAHGGRTDSNGGHRDNQNKSGLGSYHYHHGQPAHLHTKGICPYDDNSELIEAASTEGYENGYSDGYDGDSYNDETYDAFENTYKQSYSNGYNKGVADKKKIEEQKAKAYDDGYETGYNGSKSNDKNYDSELKMSYSNGYDHGLKNYVSENKQNYITYAHEDSKNFQKREFTNYVPSELLEIYDNNFKDNVTNLKQTAYTLGYTLAIKENTLDQNKFETTEEQNSYTSGYNDGSTALEKEKLIAFNAGYENTDYEVSQDFLDAEETLIASYSEGEETIKKELINKLITTVALIITFILSVITAKKVYFYFKNK